jgi:hypothetical protein
MFFLSICLAVGALLVFVVATVIARKEHDAVPRGA